MDSSDLENLVVSLSVAGGAGLLLSSIKKKKKRKCWMKDFRHKKDLKGCFSLIKNELKVEDAESYKNYIRMNDNTFQKLLELIKDSISAQDTKMRVAISAEEKLAVTLRFLATGESLKSLDFSSRLSSASLCRWIPKICDEIYKKLKGNYLKFPTTTEEWIDISNRFAIRWQFPHCIGALDGKHIAFQASRKDGAFYRNYKGFDSIVLLALVDANCRFIYVDVGWNGRISDGGVFRQSDLYQIMGDESQLPADTAIGNNRKLPYVFIGDDAFALHKHLMKPYPYHTSETAEKIFNIRLSTARQTVEHAFGLLTNRFRILQTKINMKVETVQKIVLACCALHNFIMDNNSENSGSHTGNMENLASNRIAPSNHSPLASDIRTEFANYFTEEGMVHWQNAKP